MTVPPLAPANLPDASEGDVCSSGSSNILPTKCGFKISKMEINNL